MTIFLVLNGCSLSAGLGGKAATVGGGRGLITGIGAAISGFVEPDCGPNSDASLVMTGVKVLDSLVVPSGGLTA